jgi:hypothetical protein
MVAESLACPSCGDTVPPGRLSCPHCGMVLAAVARRVDVAATYAPAREPALAPAPEPEVSVAVAADGDDDEPALEPEPEPNAPWPMPATAAAPVVAAGTYVPPSIAPPEPEPVDPAPASASSTPAELPPAPVFPRAWDPAGAAAGEGVIAATTPASVPRLSGFAMPRIDKDRVEEAADAMMLVGAFGLVLAFLAPWARVVIGSRGTGYVDTWGLAGSGHIALFLLALAVLGLAVFQNPIGRWLRTGALGVALGSFVLGLAWPYVVGPLGAGPGALLAWVSGLVMFIAGMVSLLVLRHAALPSDV